MGARKKYETEEERLEAVKQAQKRYYEKHLKRESVSSKGKKLGRPSKSEQELINLKKMINADDSDLVKAVKSFCYSCMGCDIEAVKYCKDKTCQLHQFRMGLDWSGYNVKAES